jgi:hypothetical protein
VRTSRRPRSAGRCRMAIEGTDAAGRWAVYVPLTRGGKIVAPRPFFGGDIKLSGHDIQRQ